jgi:pimeloyl-ACP methyl ester carboxylesterase
VLPVGYDWRRSVQFSGGQLANVILTNYPGRDVVFVAHSLGGIVARAAWKYLAQAGQDRVVRLITLGTPHRGSLSVPQLFGLVGDWYGRLVDLVGGPFISRESARLIVNDVIASLVAPYEMMPFRGRFGDPTDAALRNVNSYARFNAFPSTARFAAADAVQTWLADAGDPSRTLCIVGTYVQTATGVVDVGLLNDGAGYEWTGLGDGTVEAESARWPGAAFLPVVGLTHGSMPYNPKVLSMLPGLIRGNPFAFAA